LQEGVRSRADDLGIAHDFAWAAYSTGKISEAQEAMQRVANAPATSAATTDAKTFLSLTALDSEEKIPSGSESEINKALATDPNYTPALMAKAAIQLQNGDSAGATAIYNSILQRLADFAPAQKRLAAIYVTDPANAGKAYELATKARRSLGDDPDLARTLGTLSFQRREYARAVQFFQESEAKKPLEGKSLFMLGMAHLQLGHKTEAKKILDRALTAGIPDDLAKQAKDAILELDKTADQKR
jgi:Flp pilus assembly protein TadD